MNSATSLSVVNAVKDLPYADADILIVDYKYLEYISFASLRIILSLKKKASKFAFKVIDANSDVMKVFNDACFSEIIDIISSIRQASVDGCKAIGSVTVENTTVLMMKKSSSYILKEF